MHFFVGGVVYPVRQIQILHLAKIVRAVLTSRGSSYPSSPPLSCLCFTNSIDLNGYRRFSLLQDYCSEPRWYHIPLNYLHLYLYFYSSHNFEHSHSVPRNLLVAHHQWNWYRLPDWKVIIRLQVNLLMFSCTELLCLRILSFPQQEGEMISTPEYSHRRYYHLLSSISNKLDNARESHLQSVRSPLTFAKGKQESSMIWKRRTSMDLLLWGTESHQIWDFCVFFEWINLQTSWFDYWMSSQRSALMQNFYVCSVISFCGISTEKSDIHLTMMDLGCSTPAIAHSLVSSAQFSSDTNTLLTHEHKHS